MSFFYYKKSKQDGIELAAFDGHEFGIKYVLFSPGMDVIVSVGLEHDNEVIVWAWPEKHKIATNKIVGNFLFFSKNIWP